MIIMALVLNALLGTHKSICWAQSVDLRDPSQGMDRAEQSVDPYFAQESMDRSEICGSSGAIREFCV